MASQLTLDDIRHRATISVEDVASLLGVSRGLAYEAVRAGSIPSLRLGARVLVPVGHLLTVLGAKADDGTENVDASADQIPLREFAP